MSTFIDISTERVKSALETTNKQQLSVDLEVEAGNERQFLHSELFGRFLIAMTVTTFDLG